MLTAHSTSHNPENMKCMEVTGGNSSTVKHYEKPGLDLWVWHQSAGESEICGGHVHYVSSCASGRITRILMADICGAGPMFSDVAVDLRDLMMRNVNYIKQNAFVRDMYQTFENYSREGGFATALIGTFFSSTKSFELCNAGHPSPFLFRAKNKQWDVLRESQSDLLNPSTDASAGLINQQEYHQLNTHLNRGDMVFCYSNALLESEDHSGRYFSLSSLLARVKQLNWSEPSSAIAELARMQNREKANHIESKDFTLMICRANNSGVSLKDNLLSPFRLFQNVNDNTQFD